MAKYSYSTTKGEKDAIAVGRALPISTKQAIEVCSLVRGKRLERAKVLINDVLKEKAAVPFKRFTDGIGHKKGRIAAGRYPKSTCGEILKLLNSAQANAQFRGLSSPDLVVRHINAQKAAAAWHYGRRRRNAKRTTIEVVLTEAGKQEKKKEGREKKAVEKKAEENHAKTKKEEMTAGKKQKKTKTEEAKAGQ